MDVQVTKVKVDKTDYIIEGYTILNSRIRDLYLETRDALKHLRLFRLTSRTGDKEEVILTYSHRTAIKYAYERLSYNNLRIKDIVIEDITDEDTSVLSLAIENYKKLDIYLCIVKDIGRDNNKRLNYQLTPFHLPINEKIKELVQYLKK